MVSDLELSDEKKKRIRRRNCQVIGCNNVDIETKKTNPNIIYHMFPKRYREEWSRFCKKSNPAQVAYVCSTHFTDDDYENNFKRDLLGPQPRRLKLGAVPSIYPESVVGSTKNTNLVSIPIVNFLTSASSTSTGAIASISDSIPVTTSIEVEILSDNIERNIPKKKFDFKKLHQENQTLKKDITRLDRLNQNLVLNICLLKYQDNKSPANIEERYRKRLLNNFTENQLGLIMNKKKQVIWNFEEISTAFTIRYLDHNTYSYLQKDLNYPLPILTTLRKWANHINLRDGISQEILLFMKLAGKRQTKKDLITILMFDEFKVKELYEYDAELDKIVGPHNYIQVVMACGLYSKWKQPIYIGFDTKMTKNLLNEIIDELLNIEYKVVAVVSCCNESYENLWTELKVTSRQSYYHHPRKNDKIYLFCDIFHLLLLLRNAFIDHGLILDDKTFLTKSPLIRLIENYPEEMFYSYKLDKIHLCSDGLEKDQVSLATELLSSTTSTALRGYSQDNHLADFCDLINAWLDMMNAGNIDETIRNKKPYGLEIGNQNLILNKMSKTIENMRHPNEKNLQNYQRGILASINSLKNLYLDLKEKFHIDFIKTNKLSLSSLKCLFSEMRKNTNDHPTPLNAIHQLRLIILGKTTLPESDDDNQEYYISINVLKQAQVDPIIDQLSLPEEEYNFPELLSKSQKNSDDGFSYLVERIAKNYYIKYPDLVINIVHKNQQAGTILHLTKPSTWWLQKAKLLENRFQLLNEDSGTENIIEELQSKYNDIPSELIEIFIKERIFIKIKLLNYNLAEKDQWKFNESDEIESKKMKYF